MENKSMNMSALMERCADLMYAKGYTNSCIQSHVKRWQTRVLPFVQSKGSSDYTRSLGDAYLHEVVAGLSRSTAKGHARSINILNEYLETGNISTRLKTAPQYPLGGDLGAVVNALLDYEKNELRFRDGTIIHHARCLSLFINRLQIKGYKSIREIDAEDGLDFLNNSNIGRTYRLNAIRNLYKYLYRRNMIDFDCLEAITNYRVPESTPLPTVYSETEIAKIVKQAKNMAQSRVGKRDYAMLLLACRLGLRSSDIRFLTFTDIDWKKKEIRTKQYKTEVEISLPLLHDVGEAIINYIQNARPQCDLPYVFITEIYPFRALSATAISHNVARIIRSAGIKTGSRHVGSHSMRHSLATQMMKSGVPLPTISEVLGHTTTESTMIYLSVDKETLSPYALDVPPIPNTLYTQRGGLFYV